MQFFIVGLNTHKKTSPARRNVHWLVRYQWKSVLDDACQSGNSNFKVTCNLDNPWSTLIPSCTSTETRKRGKWDDTVNPLTWGESPLAFRKELWPPDLSFWDDRGALRLFPGHRTNRQVPLRPGRVRTGYTPVNPSHQFCQERDSRMTGQRHLKNLPRFDFIPWRWWNPRSRRRRGKKCFLVDDRLHFEWTTRTFFPASTKQAATFVNWFQCQFAKPPPFCTGRTNLHVTFVLCSRPSTRKDKNKQQQQRRQEQEQQLFAFLLWLPFLNSNILK